MQDNCTCHVWTNKTGWHQTFPLLTLGKFSILWICIFTPAPPFPVPSLKSERAKLVHAYNNICEETFRVIRSQSHWISVTLVVFHRVPFLPCSVLTYCCETESVFIFFTLMFLPNTLGYEKKELTITEYLDITSRLQKGVEGRALLEVIAEYFIIL